LLQLKTLFAKFIVPLVNVNIPVIVNELPKVIRPVAFKVTAQDRVTVFVVIVLAALIVISPVADQTVVLDNVIFPETVKVPDDVKVNEEPVVVKLLHNKAPVRVIVPEPEEPLKNTSSAAVGTLAPLAPPEVADQTVVLVVFHVPVPPTQYLSAIR
jgi:hypothetical protein